MRAYHNTAVLKFYDDTTGSAGVGLPVTVRLNSNQALASLFDLDEAPTANPLTTDSDGNYEFKVADGIYDVITNEGLPTEIRLNKVQIVDEALLQGVDRLFPPTLDYAINDNTLDPLGDEALNVKEYSMGNGGGAMWDTITGVGTANGIDRVAHNTLDLTLVLRVKSSLDVAQYGSIGDGTTDNTAVITRAFIHSAENNIELTVSQGAHVCLDVPPVDNLVLTGLGGALKLKDGSETEKACISYNSATELNNIVIQGIRFNGNRAGQTGAIDRQGVINIVGAVKNLRVINNIFRDTYYHCLRYDGRIGAGLINGENHVITGNTFDDCQGNAVIWFNTDNVSFGNNVFNKIGNNGGSGAGFAGQAIRVLGSRTVSITGNSASYLADSGIYCTDCESGTITGNTIRDAAKTGLKWQDGCKRVVISSNTVIDVGAQGINVWASSGEDPCEEAVISSNVVYRTGYDGTTFTQNVLTSACGIYCENTSKVTITGNTVTTAGNNSNASVGSGIRVIENGNFTNITGNTVSLSAHHGIEVTNIDRIMISDNMTFNNGKSEVGINNGIFVNAGASAIDFASIQGNHCFDNQVTKTQDSGIRLAGSNWGEIAVANNMILTSEHVTAGIIDSSTNSSISYSNNRERGFSAVSRELMQSCTFQESFKLPELTAAPSDVQDGQVVYADGTTWNPGSGEGFYGRENNLWVKW